MTNWIKYMKNHPESEVPDLEKLLDRKDYLLARLSRVVREFTHHEIDKMVEGAIDDYITQMQTVDVIREQRRK